MSTSASLPHTQSKTKNSPDDTSPSALPRAKYLPRKGTKKSRTGCIRCKARKVKCDERHPSCLNCISHGVECPYLEATMKPTSGLPTAPIRIQSLSPRNQTTKHPSSTVPSLNPQLPTLELELLHNWTFSASSTLALDTRICDFWRTTGVQIGLRCDCIMQSILALSALHLAVHTPDKRDYYTAHGLELHQRAARGAAQFMMDTAGTNTSETINTFLHSTLTTYFALAIHRNETTCSSTTNGKFPEWDFLLSSTTSLTDILNRQDALDSSLEPFVKHHLARQAWTSRTTPAQTNLEISALREIRRRVIDSVALRYELANDPTQRTEFTEIDSEMLTEDKKAAISALITTYTHALDELDLSFSWFSSSSTCPDPYAIILWMWHVSNTLLPLLKLDPPAQEAVAIFAHFAILLKYHEDQGHDTWWIRGWAEHIVQWAHDVLDQVGKVWIVWPMREVGLDFFDYRPDGQLRNTMFISLP